MWCNVVRRANMDSWILCDQMENPVQRSTVEHLRNFQKSFVIFAFFPIGKGEPFSSTAGHYLLFIYFVHHTWIHWKRRPYPFLRFKKNVHFNWMKRDFSQSRHGGLEQNDHAMWSIRVNLLRLILVHFSIVWTLNSALTLTWTHKPCVIKPVTCPFGLKLWFIDGGTSTRTLDVGHAEYCQDVTRPFRDAKKRSREKIQQKLI